MMNDKAGFGAQGIGSFDSFADDDLVISGISGRFPLADSLDELKENLFSKRNCVVPAEERWSTDFPGCPDNHMAIMKNLDKFDPEFFNMSAADANADDPQNRIMLEVSYEAIVDAGYNPKELYGKHIGVFVGESDPDPIALERNIIGGGGSKNAIGYVACMVANNLSRRYGFTGPSFAIDTACSSSGVALEDAFRRLKAGTIEAAVVGGTSLCLDPRCSKSYLAMGILSPTGESCSYDAKANGLVKGESIAAIFVQRKKDARRIYAKMHNIECTSAGYVPEGVFVPSVRAESNLFRKTFEAIGMDPSIVDYVEGHGTSTPVGDPTEINSIDDVFCKNRTKPLLLGGLKSNIGHTEATSALCSIAKVIFSFELGVIPPNINYVTPNPKCPSLTNGKIKVVTEATPFDKPLVALNNFGFGGVSVHVILERNPIEKSTEDPEATDEIPKLVVYSATTEKALTDLFDYVHQNSMPREFFALLNKSAYNSPTLTPYRGFTILQKDAEPLTSIERCSTAKRQVWYVVTGMGCQYPGMGLDLMQLDVFAESMRKSAKTLEPFGVDILDLLRPDKDYLQTGRRITPAFVTISAIQIALVDILKTLGLEPDHIIGHSSGELVCAYADGSCTAEEAILSAYYRGASADSTDLPDGAMAAVGLTWEEAKARCPEGVYPACHNATDSVTISGLKEPVEKFVEQLKSENIFARVVNAFGYGFHCQTIAAAHGKLKSSLQNVYKNPKTRTKRWLSTAYCEPHWNEPACQIIDANYFAHNLVSQVRFSEVLPHIPADAITIEIGPHHLLQSILKRSVGNKASYIGLMKRNDNNVNFLLSAIGKLYNLGLDPQVENLYPAVSFPVPRGTPMISPRIQWDHSESYYVPKYSSLIVGKSKLTAKTNSTESFLLDHCIEGRSLYPATGYIYLAWKAISETLNKPMETLPISIENFKILRATVLSPTDEKSFEVSILNMRGDFEIVEGDAVVATGKIFAPTKPMFGNADHNCERGKSSVIISGTEMYNELRVHGYEYGPAFQGLMEINMDGTDGLVKWNNEWISFLDSLLLFFGIIYENSDFKLPTGALSIKIDPKVHEEFVAGMEEKGLKGIPVKYDQHVRKCTTPGVEIRNLKLEPAPHRSLSEIVPVLEEYSFAPYNEKSGLGSELTAECESYIEVCCSMARKVVDRLNIKGQIQMLLQGVKLNKNTDVQLYLTTQKENYRLLSTIQNVLEMSASPKLAAKIEAEYHNIADILAEDMLFEAMLSEKSLRPLLDVAVENCFGRVIVTEWCDNSPMLLPAVQQILQSFTQTKTRYNLIHSVATTVDLQDMEQRKIPVERAAEKDAIPANFNDSCQLGLACFVTGSSDNLASRIRKVASLAKKGGFVLVVHKHTLTPPEQFMCIVSKLSLAIQPETEIEKIFSKEHLVVVSKKSSPVGVNAYLLRKSPPKIQLPRTHIVKVVDGEYDKWVGNLKQAMTAVQRRDNSDTVLLVAQDTPFNGIIGLVNCLRHEPGGDKIRCVFTNRSAPPFDFKNSFYSDVLVKNLLMNVYLNGTWGSFRHMSLPAGTPQGPALSACVDCTKLGDLSSFKWVEAPIKCIQSQEGNDELFHVYYSSLNFRDIMLATGKLSAGIFQQNGHRRESTLLGIEFSGRDKNGRRIMAMADGGCLSNTVVEKPLMVFDVPEKWTLEEAATIPVAYSTSYFALIIKAKLQKGEKVLIHSGTGGIGQAAIRIALSMDSEIFTTVGTPEKRNFLLKMFPRLKPENIGCSRDTSFEDMVMRRTNATGVDVVLNSLAEDKLQASVRCLARHGRFLEIGKYDLALNNTLGLSVFLKDVTFFGIQLDTYYKKNHKTIKIMSQIKELLSEGIEKGVVQPLNTTVFPIEQVELAFRFMGSGNHTGKVLLKVRDEEPGKNAVPRPMKVNAYKNISLSKNKSYIIIGGLGGFGIELAKWLVKRGAGTVVLTSRHGPTTPYHHLCLKRWDESGERVFVSNLNVAKLDEAKKLLQETTTKYGPIGGIFNSAVVLRDGFIENQSPSFFEEVCAPKAVATKYLDELSRKMCPQLDMFVCFSSISCGKGNAGQTNYGYGNSVMERICEQRKRDGLHGLAIQWGIIGDVGLVSRQMGDDAMIAGVMAQSVKSCLQCLEKFLLQDKPVVSSFVTADKSRMKTKSDDILIQLAKMFGVPDVDEMNQDRSFGEMGVDSLLGVQLRRMLESFFDVEFTLQQIRDMKVDDVKKLIEEQDKDLQAAQGKNLKNITFDFPSVLLPTEAVVPMNCGKQGLPLFIISGNDLLNEKLKKLCENVSRPVFALQSTQNTSFKSLKDMALWHLKQIQTKRPGLAVHLASVSTAGNLAIEMAILSEGEKGRLPDIRSLNIIDGALDLMESHTTTEEEKIRNVAVNESIYLCQFLSTFTSSDLTQLKSQLEVLPTLENRINMISGLVSSADKAALMEAAEFYVKKQSIIRSHMPTGKLQKDLTVVEASEKVLPNDVSSLKNLMAQISNGYVTIHRITGNNEFLIGDYSATEVAKLLNKL